MHKICKVTDCTPCTGLNIETIKIVKAVYQPCPSSLITDLRVEFRSAARIPLDGGMKKQKRVICREDEEKASGTHSLSGSFNRSEIETRSFRARYSRSSASSVD